MRYKKFYLKSIIFTFILLTILPGILTPIIAENKQNNTFSLNTVYDKTQNGFVIITETLSGLIDLDTHVIALKADKEYYFSVKFDNPNGLFLSIVVSNGIDIVAKFGDWDGNTPKSKWKIAVVLTPTTADEFTILISETNGFDMIDSKYTLYANRSGFAGIWWMILSGLGVLVILIIIFALLFSKKKKKPKKRKRKK